MLRPRCDREAVARGLCMMHYKRQRAGHDLTEPTVGDPSGHGRYGILDADGDRVRCHECGGWYRSVGAHIGRAHQMTAREYKIAHGLPLRAPLMAPDLVDGHKKRGAGKVGGEAWKRLEAKRDPTKAVQARDDDFLRRFEAGETATAIAREIGMTNSAVSYGIRRARKRRDRHT